MNGYDNETKIPYPIIDDLVDDWRIEVSKYGAYITLDFKQLYFDRDSRQMRASNEKGFRLYKENITNLFEKLTNLAKSSTLKPLRTLKLLFL